MHRIDLSKSARQDLEQAYRTTDDRRLAERYQAILMTSRHRRRSEMARDLQRSERTIQRWINSYLSEGIEGLSPKKAPGATALITAEHAPLIQDWVKQGPQSCGLDRANWTFAELAFYFYQTQGIQVSETTMRDFCHRHDIRPYRPTYRFLRANPEKQKEAAEALDDLKKSPDQ